MEEPSEKATTGITLTISDKLTTSKHENPLLFTKSKERFAVTLIPESSVNRTNQSLMFRNSSCDPDCSSGVSKLGNRYST